MRIRIVRRLWPRNRVDSNGPNHPIAMHLTKRYAVMWAVGLVVLLVLVVVVRYRQDLAQAELRTARHSGIATTPCGPIEYAVAGAGYHRHAALRARADSRADAAGQRAG